MSYSVQSVNSECVCQTGIIERIQRGSEKFSNMRHSSILEHREIIIGSYWRVGREGLFLWIFSGGALVAPAALQTQ
jgi:hypothetical protein